ncbi:MAG TPA: protein kinase [Pyrinomonadaceae bacterium]|jgi:serine/threonine protein kinase|nr:protein kinase [Pyrinomonadaceae bacterium]
MTPERWQQVKEIFDSAIKYLPEQRHGFLSQACGGDAELRSEVESLITSHEKEGSFIDEPAYCAAAELLANEKAELPSGNSIGNYEIISFISRGGMGEVYLAQDKRLNRKVALKLLPSAFTKDNDRLRRFEQEARAASALNHPNIITIYEIFEANSTHVIATEYVEGETLRQRLGRSGSSLSETLNIAIQIADALAAAHKAGIIHRDIKPENVMLRPDGYVKILDFGLAKLSEDTTGPVAAEAPTLQVRTGSGFVLGTAGYMSPEQARGLVVDNRSDIFSLGAVMYELLARRKPFEGETPSDTLASILKTEPTPLQRLVPQLPAELIRIVNKSLRKDREERYQVVKDLWLDLKALRQELEFQAKLDRSLPSENGDSPTAAMDVARSTAREARLEPTETRSAINTITESLTIELKRHKIGVAVVLATVLAVVAIGAFGIYKLVNRQPPVAAFQNIHLSRLTNSGDVIDTTISPDGKIIVYVRSDRNQQSLWVRQVSTANDKEIVPPSAVGFFGITFSPDGNDIFYAIKARLDAGTLYRVPVLGGPSTKVLEKIDAVISFAPDGKRFVLVRGNYPKPGESALVIANVDGSNEQVLAVRKRPDLFTPIFFTGPSWSPDGKLVAASVMSSPRKCNVVVFSVADGTEQVLTREPWTFASRVQWLPDMSGLLVIVGDGVNNSQHWMLSYPGGEKRRVTNDLSAYRVISLTSDGRKLATIQVDGLINLWVAPEGDATRAIRMPTGNVGFYASGGNNLSWTLDKRVVYMSNEGGVPDVWIADPSEGSRKQLTTNGGGSPVATVDGKYVVFVSARDGKLAIWRMNLDGSNPIRLSNGPSDIYPSVTPDSQWVVFIKNEGTQPTVWKVSIDGGTPVQVSDHVASSAIVSPDGKLLAYSYPESPDPFAPPNRLVVVNFADNRPVATFNFSASSTVPTLIQWASDGKSILYTVNRNSVSNVWSQPLDGSAPKQLTDFKDSLMTGFAWSHDGKMFAATRGSLMRDAVLITDLK